LTSFVVRSLCKIDNNAASTFTDVLGRNNKPPDYREYHEISSAQKYGIVNGTSATTFAPDVPIIKEQIIAIIARTLKSEMGYKYFDTDKECQEYLRGKYYAKDDFANLPNWGLHQISLATKEGIIAPSNGRFNPKEEMTRGEAAVILYEFYKKIWQ